MSAMGGKRTLATDIATDLADDYPRFDFDLSGLRRDLHRDDADGRLPVLLRLQALWSASTASRWRLLRVLFLRRRAVSTNSGSKSERHGGLLLSLVMFGMGGKRT